MSERILTPVQEGPFVGMIANRRMPIPVNAVTYAQNFYLDDGVYVGRPGMVSLGTLVDDNNVQGVVHHQELDGTRHWLAFCAGDMFEYDADSDTWTQTDLSSEGITMSSTAQLSFTGSRGRLIIADGTNDPWMLSGTTGGWTFTTLSAAREAAGAETYFDKIFLFGLPDPDQNEFEWSDEGDPTAGYVPSDQVWEFAQRDAGRIVNMVALNEAMAIFKEDSATWLTGAVDEDFRTNANREGLSETEGIIGRRAAQVLDGSIYLLSQGGPRVISQGVWGRINEQNGFNILEDVWNGLNTTQWDNSFSFIDLARRQVVFMVPVGVDSGVYTGLAYSVDSQSWSVYKWDSATFDFKCAGNVEDDDGNEYVLFGTADGQVFKYGTTTDSDSDVAIERILRSRPYGRSQPTVIKRLVEVHLLLNLTTNLNAQVRPVQNGTVHTGDRKLFGWEDYRGTKRYRRGMNVTGYDVGWEFYHNQAEETVSIESAVTMVSVVGQYPSI